MTDPANRAIAVVGIGADGVDGLSSAAMREIAAAEVLVGSTRQLGLVPTSSAVRVSWPTPLVPSIPGIVQQHSDRRMCILASGDPMFHGIGVTLARIIGAERLRIFPAPSSLSLACARLGWAAHDTPVISLVTAALFTVLPELSDGRRLIVLSENDRTPGALANLLQANGFGESSMTVLEQMAGPSERRFDGIADAWHHAPGDALNVIGLVCKRSADHPRLTRMAGLDDSVYSGDGQLTKREVRALTLSALAPAPNELLWDVGGGSGTIAIEWMRHHRSCRAMTFERSESRRDQIKANASALGVTPRVCGAAPDAFGVEATPDAIFVGGGLTQPGLLTECWSRLGVGGRLVANAVTAESEAMLLEWFHLHGGRMSKFQIYRAGELGDFTAWRPQLPVTLWSTTKTSDADAS